MSTIEVVRKLLLLTLTVSLAGTLVELLLLEQYTFIPIDHNTASDSAILSIPGAGRNVLREFKEYRPYPDIEKFRREMAKYWNEKEVARLERYVTIKQ